MNLYCGRHIVELGVQDSLTAKKDGKLLNTSGNELPKAVTIIGGEALCHFCVCIDQAQREIQYRNGLANSMSAPPPGNSF